METTLPWFVSGPEPQAVLLHGFLGRAQDWAAVLAQVDIPCAACDLPGHGAARDRVLDPDFQRVPWDTTCGWLASDLAIVAGKRPLWVVGYSMGGRIALDFVRRHPNRCTGLFLESASPGLDCGIPRAARWETDQRTAQALRTSGGGFREWLEAWYDQALFGLLGNREAVLRRAESKLDNDPEALAAALLALSPASQPNGWPLVDSFDGPLWFVTGERDAKYAALAERVRRSNEKAVVRVALEAGHTVHADQPDTFAAWLREAIAT